MERLSRRKRASESDLYKSCALGADCIPDVKNKVEGNTLADFLLKIFGSVIYLGNLGIGTGRGSGGQYGYTPFGGTRPTTSTTPVRPSIPTELVPTGDIVPVTAFDSAIVPLTDGVPETGLIDTPGVSPGLPTDSITVTTTIDPISEVTGIGEHPSVIYTSDNVAQLDVQLQPPPPKRILLDPSIYNTETPVFTHASHVDPDYNVFVDSQLLGEHIGQPEEIELSILNSRAEFEIDEGPVRSTPLSTRLINRTRDLYHRFVEQVPAQREVVLSRPSDTFEFENPAFEPEVTDVFEKEVQQIARTAGSDQLQDVTRLSDIRYTESPLGTVRVSRLGQRSGMITRSGLQIGKRVHFYYDVSPITPVTDVIELRTFGEYSHEFSIIDELTDSSFINPFEMPIEGSLQFSDDMLVDTLNEEFTNSHVVLTATDTEGDTFDTPTLPPGIGTKVFTDDYGKSLIISHPNPTDLPVINMESPLIPIEPPLGIYVNYFDYDLHPSLLLRKRKSPVLFTL